MGGSGLETGPSSAEFVGAEYQLGSSSMAKEVYRAVSIFLKGKGSGRRIFKKKKSPGWKKEVETPTSAPSEQNARPKSVSQYGGKRREELIDVH